MKWIYLILADKLLLLLFLVSICFVIPCVIFSPSKSRESKNRDCASRERERLLIGKRARNGYFGESKNTLLAAAAKTERERKRQKKKGERYLTFFFFGGWFFGGCLVTAFRWHTQRGGCWRTQTHWFHERAFFRRARLMVERERTRTPRGTKCN